MHGPYNYIFECPICQRVVKKAQSMKCCKKTFCEDSLNEGLKRYLMCPHCRFSERLAKLTIVSESHMTTTSLDDS